MNTIPTPTDKRASAFVNALPLDDLSPADAWELALLEFGTWQQASGYSERTIGNYVQLLRALERFTSSSPSRVTLAQLLSWQRRPAIALSSKQRDRSYLRCFFRWLHAEGLASVDASFRLPPVRVPMAKPRPITVRQLEEILTNTSHRKTRTMILLGAFQGLRAGEIARVRGEQFDLVENRFRYVGKGGFEHDVEIHPLIRDEARHYPRRGPWFPGRKGNEGNSIHPKSVSDLMSDAFTRAGIDSAKLTGHSLRHFYGTELFRAGHDIRVVQRLMGHQSIASTQRYVDVDPDRLHDALNSLPKITLPDTHYRRPHRSTAENKSGARRRGPAQ